MKFVYFGYDFSLNTLQYMLDQGHQLLGIFSFPCDGIFNFNDHIKEIAAQNNIPYFEEKPTSAHVQSFIAQGAELFVSAGYMYKIPPIDDARIMAVNIHPAYLPQGRGVMPTPYIIMSKPQAAGVTLHKINNRFDAGDIIAQERLQISTRETVESYSTRALNLYPKLLKKFLDNPKKMWQNAIPQDESAVDHFPVPTDEMRMLDFKNTVTALDKILRAFGRFGALARLDNKLYVIYNHDYWQDAHDYKCGEVVLRRRRSLCIAAKDGFVLLKEFSIINE